MGLETVPANIGREAGYTVDTQSITGLTHRGGQPITLTFTLSILLESPINLHVFGLWEEAEPPGENPRGHRENTQHTERPAFLFEPSCCEATTAPPCRPY